MAGTLLIQLFGVCILVYLDNSGVARFSLSEHHFLIVLVSGLANLGILLALAVRYKGIKSKSRKLAIEPVDAQKAAATHVYGKISPV